MRRRYRAACRIGDGSRACPLSQVLPPSPTRLRLTRRSGHASLRRDSHNEIGKPLNAMRNQVPWNGQGRRRPGSRGKKRVVCGSVKFSDTARWADGCCALGRGSYAINCTTRPVAPAVLLSPEDCISEIQSWLCQAFLAKRRRTMPMPATPAPSSASEAGSGVFSGDEVSDTIIAYAPLTSDTTPPSAEYDDAASV